ncbi:MAG TPA: TlpA disulfide reductase family protein [Thermoanaerobaculia bacterium]|nr:TlpA disulfide reductase family protein [Thermoanaerobaculia bacterium]
MRKSLLFLLLIVPVAGCGERREAAAPLAANAPPPAQSVVEVGRPMPSYSAELLDGSTFDVAKERGNVLFLNLWATWCGPCRYEIPELEKLHNEHLAERFKVVGVSVDEGGDQVVREFVEEQRMTYPIVLDPEGRLAMLFDTMILPTSAIVDRNGTVIWKKIGVVSLGDAEMMRAIEQALKS